MLNKWKCPYSPFLYLNLNAMMCKINRINLAVWGASRKPSWLVVQMEELRGFHYLTHFSQNSAVLSVLEFCSTAGYSPAVEEAEPWHIFRPEFQLQWPSKISRGGSGKLQVSLSQLQRCYGHKNHWEVVPHLKMIIFLCHIAYLLSVLCLFRMSFGLTQRICFFIDFIIVLKDPWGFREWAQRESSLLLPQGTKAFPCGRKRSSWARMWKSRRQTTGEIHLSYSAAGAI